MMLSDSEDNLNGKEMPQVFPLDIPSKEEFQPFEVKVKQEDASEDVGKFDTTLTTLEKKEPLVTKKEVNHIEESTSSQEDLASSQEDFTSLEDVKIKKLLPIVKIERILKLEQAVKGVVKCEPKVQGDQGGATKQMSTADNCQEGVQTSVATQHEPLSLKMFVCVRCGGCHMEKDELDDHICDMVENDLRLDFHKSEIKLKTNENVKKYICDTCGATYKTLSHLNRHRAMHLGGPFTCGTCSLQFDRKNLLMNHCKIHLNEEMKTCNVCGKMMKANWFPRHVASHNIGAVVYPFNCLECGKLFKTKVELNTHLVIHSDERNYSCSHCKQSFKRRSDINYHLEHYHIRDVKMKYECNECSKSFAFKHYMKTHKLKDHSESRPLVCNECGDTFKEKKCLQIHMLKHVDLKPYSCSFCGNKFKQLPHLKRHELLHTGVKPYHCKICGKSFRDSSNFKVHQIAHTGLRPFKCDICKKDFKQRSHLNTHKKYHSQSRPYVCTICGDSFKVREILKSHVLIHSKVKPFNCEDCGKSFVQVTAFKRHKC